LEGERAHQVKLYAHAWTSTDIEVGTDGTGAGLAEQRSLLSVPCSPVFHISTIGYDLDADSQALVLIQSQKRMNIN
jgi:hypothetical protein